MSRFWERVSLLDNVRTNLASAAALAFLVYFGHPALALVAGMTLSLTLNRPPMADGSRYGKYLLKTAIVLLGFKLNTNQLLDISGTYALPIAAYVCMTACAGLMLGKLLRADNETNALIASGTAICGGTTIATLSPIIGARAERRLARHSASSFCLMRLRFWHSNHRTLAEPFSRTIRCLGCASHSRYELCRCHRPNLWRSGSGNSDNGQNRPDTVAYPAHYRCESLPRLATVQNPSTQFRFFAFWQHPSWVLGSRFPRLLPFPWDKSAARCWSWPCFLLVRRSPEKPLKAYALPVSYKVQHSGCSLSPRCF